MDTIRSIPQERLAEHTTFRLGGVCKNFILCQRPEELEKVAGQLIAEKAPFLLIGEGSNLLVSDKGVDCSVICFMSETPLIQREGDRLIVSASTRLDDLVEFAAEEGLDGIGFASGIYGTVGGAIVGNAGAFGEQVSDPLESIVVLTRGGERREISKKDLGFTYRYSNLKETDDIVLSAVFSLKAADQVVLLDRRKEILDMRQKKHPDVRRDPCAGSFFRNIEFSAASTKRTAAGWFLDQAGTKGMRRGRAHVFEKHANMIIASQGARAQDVFDLSVQMQQAVKEKFSIDLVREVRLVGEFDGAEGQSQDLVW